MQRPFPPDYWKSDGGSSIQNWRALLHSTGSGILSTLTVNCIYLVVIAVYFSQRDGSFLDSGFALCATYASLWAILNFIALFVLILIQTIPDADLNRIFHTSATTLWASVGEFILMTRLMHLITAIFRNSYLGNMVCFCLSKDADDKSFLLPLMFILIDFSQLMIMPLAMFPSPWCLIFCFIELSYQLLRIIDCYDRIPDFAREGILFFNVMFAFIVYFTSKAFEGVACELLSNNESRVKATRKKLLYVEFLCQELKAPLQIISNAFETTSASFFDERLVKKSFETIQEIRVMVDKLLLLLKIEEGRFALHSSSVISKQDFLLKFQRIVIDNLSFLSGEEKVNVIKCTIAPGIEKVLIDRFVINTFLNELFCVIIKVCRSSSSETSVFKSMHLEVQPDFKALKLRLCAHFLTEGAPFDPNFVSVTISKMIKQCSGEFSIENGTISAAIPCFMNELEEFSGTSATIHSHIRPFDEHLGSVANDIIAHVYVKSSTFLRFGLKVFEKVGIKCKILPSIEEVGVGDPNIIVLEDDGFKTFLDTQVNVPNCLVVLLSSGNSYYDHPKGPRGLNFIILPFPCLYGDVKHIRDYYNRKVHFLRDAAAKPLSNKEYPEKIKYSIFSPMFHLKYVFDSFFRPLFIKVKDYIGSTPNKLNVLGQKFNHKRSLCFINLFDDDVEMSFYDWRLLTGTPSSVLVVTVVSFVTFRALYNMLMQYFSVSKILDGRGIAVYAFMIIITLLRHRLTSALGLSIYKYWLYFGYFIAVLELLSIFQLFIECTPTNFFLSCSFNFPRLSVIKDIQSFSSGSFSGLTLVALLIFNFQSSHFGWGFYFIWPHGPLLIFPLKFLWNLCILYLFSETFPRRVIIVIVATFIQAEFVYFISLYKSEFWYRDIFKNMEQSKFSEIYMSTAVEEFAKDFKIPAQNLSFLVLCISDRFQNQFAKMSFNMNEDTLKNLNSLNLGYLCHKVIHEQIAMISNNLEPRDESDSNDGIILLEEELIWMAKVFSDSNFIKLFIVVDPELSFVKIKRSILQTLVINMLKIALMNIMRQTKVLESQEITVMAKLDSPIYDDYKYGSSERCVSVEKNVAGLFYLIILDTGVHRRIDSNDLGQSSFLLLANKLNCDYQVRQLDRVDFKNIQYCKMQYETVSRPEGLKSCCNGEVISASRTSSRAIDAIQRIHFSSLKTRDDSKLYVLLFDCDNFTSYQTKKLLRSFGWKVVIFSSLDKLFQFSDILSVHLTIIDDKSNRFIISSTGNDVAMVVRMMGFPFPIIALMNSLGEKPSSSMFSNSLAKPLVETSVQRLKTLSLNLLCEMLFYS